MKLNNVIELIKELKKEAEEQFERRIVAIFTDKKLEELKSIFKLLEGKNSIFVSYEKLDLDFYYLEFKDSKKVLGQTFDNAIIDMRENIHPDDLGRIVDSVRGGGIIIFVFRKLDEFLNYLHNFKKNLVYGINLPPRNLFEERLLKKLEEGKPISIITIENEDVKILKFGSIKKEKFLKKSIFIPKSKAPKKLLRLCKTQDQVNVINNLIEFFESNKKVFILKANRGRGKSASLGLFISYLFYKFEKEKKRIKISICALEKENVKVLYDFLILGLKTLNIKFKKEDMKIKSNFCYLEYNEPIKVLDGKFDIVITDEAAAISTNILIRIAKNFDKCVFSSTIHGYEGSGRSFGIKFREFLQEEKIESEEYEMKEPIRYSEDDEVEKWIFDLLLLNSEPSELEKEDLMKIWKNEYEYLKIDVENIFKDEELLRNFFGIYVIAHYRNRPRDLGILADAPHHFVRLVTIKGTKKVLNALHLCYEGELSEELINLILEKGAKEVYGNIIPGILLRHYREKEIAKLKGIRIVRIATHPQIFGLGIGSYALKMLEEEFKDKVDYIGTVFGISPKLAKFWIKNNFIPLHISAQRNQTSGEYSTIWVKPLNEKAKEIIDRIYFEFKLRVINALSDAYYDIELDSAYYLLSFPIDSPYFPILTHNQIKRIDAFYRDLLPYETVSDVVKEIAKFFFLTKFQSELNEFEQKLLIGKLFLGKGWKKLSLDLKKQSITQDFRNLVKKMWERIRYLFE
ncbi:MAG: GNAT family N-acetyltransferase [Candidatus Aenigmatarchaeota archaeon]